MTDEPDSEPTSRTTGRRSILGAVGGTIAGISVATPAVGARADDDHGAENATDAETPTDHGQQTVRAGVEPASVIEAAEAQETLIESGRYCAVHGAILDSIDRDVGDQVRIRRAGVEGEYAVYTVSERLEEDEPGTVRMGLDGRERLGTEDSFSASVDPTVVRPDLNADGAAASDEFIEYLARNGDRIAVLSPHGGDIAPGTGEQAELATEGVSGLGVTHWGTRGWYEERGAFERWFVQSTDISPASFPQLQRIYDRGFEYGVSFRGGGDEGVEVFGDEDDELTQAVADAIDAAAEDLEVSTQEPDDDWEDEPYADAPLVRRLVADGQGVWLEQTTEAREDYGDEIATAVAEAFASRGHS